MSSTTREDDEVRNMPLVATAVAVVFATPLAAKPVDNYVSTLIEEGQYQSVQAALEARIVGHRADANALLNLAFIYAQTDRSGAAAQLYRRVLDMPDANVRTNVGAIASSHALARSALGPTATIASR